jgi:hypothetical protein
MFGSQLQATAQGDGPDAELVAGLIADGQWYAAASDGQKKDVNLEPSVEEAWDEAHARREVDPFVQSAVISDIWRVSKQRTEAKLRTSLDAGIQGTNKKDAIKRFKQERHIAADTLFNDILNDNFDDEDDPKRMMDVLAETWWTAQPREDPVTGALNFGDKIDPETGEVLEKGPDTIRAEVEKVAHENGIPLKYITGSDPGDYRGVRFDDEVARKAVLEFEAAQETLRPYWDIGTDWSYKVGGRDLWQEYLVADVATQRKLRVSQRIKDMIAGQARLRQAYARVHPEAADALRTWYGRAIESGSTTVQESVTPAPTPRTSGSSSSILDGLNAGR